MFNTTTTKPTDEIQVIATKEETQDNNGRVILDAARLDSIPAEYKPIVYKNPKLERIISKVPLNAVQDVKWIDRYLLQAEILQKLKHPYLYDYNNEEPEAVESLTTEVSTSMEPYEEYRGLYQRPNEFLSTKQDKVNYLSQAFAYQEHNKLKFILVYATAIQKLIPNVLPMDFLAVHKIDQLIYLLKSVEIDDKEVSLLSELAKHKALQFKDLDYAKLVFDYRREVLELAEFLPQGVTIDKVMQDLDYSKFAKLTKSIGFLKLSLSGIPQDHITSKDIEDFVSDKGFDLDKVEYYITKWDYFQDYTKIFSEQAFVTLEVEKLSYLLLNNDDDKQEEFLKFIRFMEPDYINKMSISSFKNIFKNAHLFNELLQKKYLTTNEIKEELLDQPRMIEALKEGLAQYEEITSIHENVDFETNKANFFQLCIQAGLNERYDKNLEVMGCNLFHPDPQRDKQDLDLAMVCKVYCLYEYSKFHLGKSIIDELGGWDSIKNMDMKSLKLEISHIIRPSLLGFSVRFKDKLVNLATSFYSVVYPIPSLLEIMLLITVNSKILQGQIPKAAEPYLCVAGALGSLESIASFMAPILGCVPDFKFISKRTLAVLYQGETFAVHTLNSVLLSVALGMPRSNEVGGISESALILLWVTTMLSTVIWCFRPIVFGDLRGHTYCYGVKSAITNFCRGVKEQINSVFSTQTRDDFAGLEI